VRIKSIVTKIGIVVGYVILIPFAIFMLVAILPLIILTIALDWWRKLFMYLRHDPPHRVPKKYRIYNYSGYPKGKKGLREYFDKFVTAIQKNADVTDISEIRLEELGNNQGENADEYGFTFSVTIQTSTGKAHLEMQACGDTQGDDGVFVALEDGDVPLYLNVVYTQNDGLRTVFDVSGDHTLEFLIASMQYGQVLSNAGQIWTRLHKEVYAVNYGVKSSEKSDRIGNDYGYRKAFSNAKARMYFFDRKY